MLKIISKVLRQRSDRNWVPSLLFSKRCSKDHLSVRSGKFENLLRACSPAATYLNALPVLCEKQVFFLMVFHWFYKVFWSPRASKLDLKLELCWSSSWEASWSDLGMVLEASWDALGASVCVDAFSLLFLPVFWGLLGDTWPKKVPTSLQVGLQKRIKIKKKSMPKSIKKMMASKIEF